VNDIEDNKLCYGCFAEVGSGLTCPKCGYMAETVADSHIALPPGTVLQKKYLIGKVLGQGGFGITYLAWDLMLNIKLAIKEYMPEQLATRTTGQNSISVYRSALTDEYEYGLKKFIEEARTLARFIEHPNVISVRDYFEANGTAYLVMNYIEGVTLHSYLKSSGGRIDEVKAMSVFMPVLDALKEVHAVGVLHRDISPDNLLVSTMGRVVLIDFGAARQSMGEKNKSMSVIMKAGFSPEEQYRSKGVQGPWTDIYAVAATMYYSITGQKPPESLDRLADDLLLPPSGLGIEISETFEQAMMKALAVKAEERYQTAEEFQADLMRKPVEAVEQVESEISQADSSDVESAIEDLREDSVIFDLQTVSTDSGPAEKAFKVNYFVLGVVIVASVAALAPYYSDFTTIPVWAGIAASEEAPVNIPTETDVAASEEEPLKEEVGQVVATINWDNGLYNGDVLDGVPSGKGTWTGEDGSTYDGNWYDGRFFGNGIYKHPDGKLEEGFWADGQLPTYYIEEHDAEIIELKLFEAGYESGDFETFEYKKSFSASQTKFIYWMLEIDLDSQNYDRKLNLTEAYYRISGGRVYDFGYMGDVTFTIDANTNGGWFWTGYGNASPGAAWYLGEYMVVLAAGDQVVAIETFDFYW
jgi:serine/threonine protein kinase